MVTDARLGELLRLSLGRRGARLWVVWVGRLLLWRQRFDDRGGVAHEGRLRERPRPEGTAGPWSGGTAAKSVEDRTWEPSDGAASDGRRTRRR